MTKETSVISHNSKEYLLNIGSSFKNLDSDPAKAIYEVCIEDIILPNGKTAGEYKLEKKIEYDALQMKLDSSSKKYLNRCSLIDFKCNWDDLITLCKKEINDACVHLLLPRRKRSEQEQYQILKAASNGHITAMYYIGTALSDGQDDNCLLWLSMAHNRGHLGACYAISMYLARNKNFLDSLRCLIISADGGLDLAYLNLFDITIITNMFKIEDTPALETMLEELLKGSNYSSARYFKGMLLLLQGKRKEGAALLTSFMKAPKKPLPKNTVDIAYDNQVQILKNFIENILRDLSSGTRLLNTIANRSSEANFVNFQHYDELVKELDKELRSSI